MGKVFKAFIFVLFVGFLVGCGGSGSSGNSGQDNPVVLVDDEPGSIAGLGDADGEVTGEEFVLPDGVYIEGEVTGPSHTQPKVIDEDRVLGDPEANAFDIITVSGGVDTIVGSGGKWVLLAFYLNNTNDRDVEVVFPAGLVIKSKTGNSQNGVLIKKTSVVIPSKAKYRVALAMYCANAHKSSSSGHKYSEHFIISNSRTLWELINLVANKKINIEEYSDAERGVYSAIVGKLTQIVWNITDSQLGLTQNDRAYINSLPDSI
jgi:hypothetical protein